jgi:hypothetical protein
MNATDITGTQAHKTLNLFILFLVVSLIGNACADFGFIWFAVSQIKEGVDPVLAARSSHLLSSYYLGQSVGLIFLAPILAAYTDRYKKRYVSIALDLGYALFLGALLAVNSLGLLNASLLLLFSLVTTALGALHRNAVGFSALKEMSGKIPMTSMASKFNAAYFIVGLVGSALAGMLYQWKGLNSCLIVGILTFIPMPFIYVQIFSKNAPTPDASKRNLIGELKEGALYIYRDKVLFVNAVSVGIWNVTANMLPGVVGIAFQKFLPGRLGLASFAVSVSLFFGVVAYIPLHKIAASLSVRKIMSYSLIPAALMMLVCALYPSPLSFTLAFALSCCGSALLNIFSSSVRVSRVPAALLGRVNTAHLSILSVGQVLGSILFLPYISRNLSGGALCVAISYVAASLYAYWLMPKSSLSQVIDQI